MDISSPTQTEDITISPLSAILTADDQHHRWASENKDDGSLDLLQKSTCLACSSVKMFWTNLLIL